MTRILVVEDDAVSLRRISQVLTISGYEVTACSSLSRAFNAFGGTPFDAILSDYNLGEDRQKTGLTLWQYANRRSRDPVFIATSSEMEKWQELKDIVKPRNLHLIPKKDYRWDDEAVLAKLQQLGL